MECGRINQWFCGSSSGTNEFSHASSTALCLLVNTQRHICANRIHNSLGWCEACDLNQIWAWFKRGFIDLELEKGRLYTWWRHRIKTFSALLAFCLPVTGGFPTERQVTRSFDFFLIGAWTNSWANNGDASDLRHHYTHNDVIVMKEMINLSTFGDGISRNSVKD